MLQGKNQAPPHAIPDVLCVCVCVCPRSACVVCDTPGRLNTVCANNDSVAVPELRSISLYVCVCFCVTVLSPLKAVKELLAMEYQLV